MDKIREIGVVDAVQATLYLAERGIFDRLELTGYVAAARLQIEREREKKREI